jgi:hypothetical protein
MMGSKIEQIGREVLGMPIKSMELQGTMLLEQGVEHRILLKP